MREMLFRAWDKVSKKYREFDGMHDTMTINEDGKVEYYNLQNGSGGDEYILEQFTGLTDKNGQKVFEGDIVKCHAMQTTEVVIVEDIRKIPVQFKWVDIYDGATIEVIGNIHDNKKEGA